MAVVALSAVGATASGDIPGYRASEYGELLAFLEARGHRLVEPGDPSATHFVSLDHNSRSLAAIDGNIEVGRRTLVVFEPRMVLPDNYRATVKKRYGNVIAMAPSPGHPSFLPWPQRDWRAENPRPVPRIPGSTAIINANKLSAIRGSLYGLRRRVIAEFDRAALPLTLAGANWDRRGRALLVENARALAYALINRERLDLSEWASPLPLGGSVDYIGRVDDKQAVFRASEFAVVIENSATYVSEKLFDAVIAGCVPLYVGPPLGEYDIPEGVAVVLPQRPAAFTEAVRDLGAENKNAVLAAGRRWLASDDTYERWGMPHALERLAASIHAKILDEPKPQTAN